MRIPIVTMEEVPVLSAAEREDFMAGLREAEEDIAAGRGTPFDPDTFVEDMMRRRAAYLATKKA